MLGTPIDIWPLPEAQCHGWTAPEIAEAMTWTVDKAQRVID
jgi:hypothetical protein